MVTAPFHQVLLGLKGPAVSSKWQQQQQQQFSFLGCPATSPRPRPFAPTRNLRSSQSLPRRTRNVGNIPNPWGEPAPLVNEDAPPPEGPARCPRGPRAAPSEQPARPRPPRSPSGRGGDYKSRRAARALPPGVPDGERRSSRAPASLPPPEDRRPPKPLAWLGPTEPAAQHSGLGSSKLKFWGPPGSPGNPLLPGPGDPGVLAGKEIEADDWPLVHSGAIQAQVRTAAGRLPGLGRGLSPSRIAAALPFPPPRDNPPHPDSAGSRGPGLAEGGPGARKKPKTPRLGRSPPAQNSPRPGLPRIPPGPGRGKGRPARPPPGPTWLPRRVGEGGARAGRAAGRHVALLRGALAARTARCAGMMESFWNFLQLESAAGRGSGLSARLGKGRLEARP
uniref:basic salivary proline-rich protein 2-like n=1 Tax=Panthera onca TaxID=9690 RepID=UPI002955D0E3|nr:basic salivary proline-rich protein 2-like [Panthera onca]